MPRTSMGAWMFARELAGGPVSAMPCGAASPRRVASRRAQANVFVRAWRDPSGLIRSE